MKKFDYSSKKIFFSLFTVFIVLFTVNAESFRVRKAHILKLNDDNEVSVKTGINDATGIFLPEDELFINFIDGIELKFDIPESLASWRDSVACSIYANISPSPSESKIDYAGTRSFVQTLPGRLSWILQIPLSDKAILKENKYTTVADIIPGFPEKSNVLFIRLQPVMKGIPEEATNSVITITAKPILKNQGILELSLTSQEASLNKCTLFIDDIPLSEANELLVKNNTVSSAAEEKHLQLLETGIHNLSIISDYYRNEIRTIRIDKAKITKLQIEMKSIEPTIIITAPEGANVLIDDEKFENIGKETIISEGEHKFSMMLGDYEIVRNLNIQKGKTYTINLSIDLQINEF